MTRQVREVHLPQDFATGYDKRLSVMLYQYLRELYRLSNRTLDDLPLAVDSVDFNDQQALNFRIENRTSDPGSPATGQIWLRTDL